MYKVKLTAKAKKELKKISRQHQFALGQIFDELKEYPKLGKPLGRELTGQFSYRISVYRIVYKIQEKDKIVYILTAGHRAIAYQKRR
jgi:mRNA interferase RelE/StbE